MALDLSALDKVSTEVEGVGKPLQVRLELVDEDPNQPRIEFEAQALRELAASIGASGVKQPISVRPHPSTPGRWMLNFGARRLRASTLAGKETIPAFVDEVLGAYDQVIENEQRQGLSPLELALFVQKRIAAGDSQAAIARGIAKSKMMVTYATALIDASDWLMGLYRSGRCTGLAELYELRKLHAGHRKVVEAWAEGLPDITRRDVAELKAELAGAGQAQPAAGKSKAKSAASIGGDAAADDEDIEQEAYAMKIVVKHEGKKYQLVGRFVTDLAPSEPGLIYVRKGRDEPFEVDVTELELGSVSVKVD